MQDNWATAGINEPITDAFREEMRTALYSVDPTDWNPEDFAVAHFLAENERLLRLVKALEDWDKVCGGKGYPQHPGVAMLMDPIAAAAWEELKTARETAGR